ncbi:MAG: hypothetical protein H0T78_05520 [Longispora sp.]|nr:hypothetical protein [Longispora sp. (in: high G+C Gram-positive bacteria)]
MEQPQYGSMQEQVEEARLRIKETSDALQQAIWKVHSSGYLESPAGAWVSKVIETASGYTQVCDKLNETVENATLFFLGKLHKLVAEPGTYEQFEAGIDRLANEYALLVEPAFNAVLASAKTFDQALEDSAQRYKHNSDLQIAISTGMTMLTGLVSAGMAALFLYGPRPDPANMTSHQLNEQQKGEGLAFAMSAGAAYLTLQGAWMLARQLLTRLQANQLDVKEIIRDVKEKNPHLDGVSAESEQESGGMENPIKESDSDVEEI